MSDSISEIDNKRPSNLKENEKKRLDRDIYLIKANQHRYSSERAYIKDITECRNAYNETVNAITQLEKEADSAQDLLSTREYTEFFLLLLELGIKAPSASFRSWFAKKLVKNWKDWYELQNVPLPKLKTVNTDLSMGLKEALEKLKNDKLNNKKLSIEKLDALATELGVGFQNLNENKKIQNLTEALEKRKITGSWKGYTIPEWLDKSLLIAAISVALWEIVEAPEQQRVVKIAKEAVLLSAGYATAEASERLLMMALALAPESEGSSMVVYVGLYIVLIIVSTIVGEGVAELFDSIFGSSTPPALTKDLINSLDKNLVKDLSKKLQKEF